MRLRSVLAMTILFPAVLAGCLDGPGGTQESEAEFRLGGTFTENATQENVEDLAARAEAHGGEARIMESFPLQFDVRGFDNAACEDLHAELTELEYVASLGACEPVTHSENPNEPVSSDSG